MTFQPPGAPSCYGSDLWSPTDPACVGGPDAAYTHPTNNTHVRERCRFFASCAQASSANRAQKQQQHFIPSGNLTAGMQPVQIAPRPGYMPVNPPPRPMTVGFQHQPQPLAHPPYMGQMAPPWAAQHGPQQVPMPYQSQGAQMPSYLAVPEPTDSGHWFKRLLRECFRSMGKATGHTTASFFDHTPIANHRTPEE